MYRLNMKDMDRLVDTYLDAFMTYPKMMIAFPDNETRKNALKMLFWYYASYDIEYGKAIAPTEDIDGAVLYTASDEIEKIFERYAKTGAPEGFLEARNNLTIHEQQMWDGLLDELEKLEEGLDLPERYIYVDFLGVRTDCQGKGIGSKLINEAISEGNTKQVPLVLFTNTEADISFYEAHGFEVFAETRSEDYGFVNTYLMRKPD